MKKVMIIVLIVVLVLVVAFPVGIFFFSGHQVTKMLEKSDKKISAMPGMDISFYEKGPMKKMAEEGLEYMDTLEKQEFTMTSFDGFKLHAYYFPNPKGETNKFFLGMHGFKSGPLHEYAPYIKHYFDLGFNVFVPDERAHYKSEGDYISMGANERYDVVDWSNFIIHNFGNDIQILIQGVSMGAASVCLASSLDLPKQVIGIVSDCAYSSFQDIMANTMKSMKGIPAKPIISMLVTYLKWFRHMDFKDASAVKQVANAKVPILFIHGKLDQIVPVECSQKLYDACGSKKKLWIIDEANHAESVGYRTEEYFKVVKEFFEL